MSFLITNTPTSQRLESEFSEFRRQLTSQHCRTQAKPHREFGETPRPEFHWPTPYTNKQFFQTTATHTEKSTQNCTNETAEVSKAHCARQVHRTGSWARIAHNYLQRGQKPKCRRTRGRYSRLNRIIMAGLRSVL